MKETLPIKQTLLKLAATIERKILFKPNDMSLEKKITAAWNKQAYWLWLLFPLSLLYALVLRIKKLAYQLGLKKSYRAPIAVMVVGNITVGGSGKTPLIISLVSWLKNKQVKVGVISRGYGGNAKLMPKMVTPYSQPSEVGDEPCLIYEAADVPVAVCPNRQQAIELLLSQFKDLQLIIADDGLQHLALQRDIEWIVVDGNRGFGNQQLLPVGYLREPIKCLEDATIIWHGFKEDKLQSVVPRIFTGNKLAKQNSLNQTMQLEPQNLQPLLTKFQRKQRVEPFINNKKVLAQINAKSFTKPKAPQTVYAVSGIGYPQRFFDTLNDLGFKVLPQDFPDHHQFKWQDICAFTQHPIVITQKDAIKIKPMLLQRLNQAIENLQIIDDSLTSGEDDIFKQTNEIKQVINVINNIWVLPVTANLSQTCYDTLTMQLRAFNINI